MDDGAVRAAAGYGVETQRKEILPATTELLQLLRPFVLRDWLGVILGKMRFQKCKVSDNSHGVTHVTLTEAL